MTAARRGRAFKVGAAAVLAAIVVVAGYVAARAQRQVSPPPMKLSIAMPLLPRMALIHVAAVNGYFAEEGLDVTILPVEYGAKALAWLLERKCDIAATAEVPFVISIMKGGAVGMFAGMASVSNDEAIIARRDRAIAVPKDLAGKKIGVTFGTSGSYFLWAFLARHRLAFDSITLVDLPPDRLVAALAGGSVDAIAAWQPMGSQASAALGANALTFTEIGAYRSAAVALARSEFLEAHPAAIEKLVRAMLKAEQFVQSRPEETLTLAAAWLKMDVADLRPTWSQTDFRVDMLQSRLINLEDEARWAMGQGYVLRGPVPNFLPRLYLDALLAVRPERVTVLR